MKTQIEDLERFIDFLQGEASSPGPYVKKKPCNCNSTESAFPIFNQPSKSDFESNQPQQQQQHQSHHSNQSTIDLLKKVLSVVQIFAITQLTCGSSNNTNTNTNTNTFEKNSLKKTSNHFGYN